jgi:hypothetical protein
MVTQEQLYLLVSASSKTQRTYPTLVPSRQSRAHD